MTGSGFVMALRELRVLLLGRLTRPRTTVRWRLTLLYGGLFLASGTALLAITYALLAHADVTEAPQTRVPVPQRPPHFPFAAPSGLSSAAIAKLLNSAAGRPVFEAITHGQRVSDLHQLLIWSAIALTIAAVASMLLGWLVARRVLRPLRTITAATQKISETNLHERLGLGGPRDELTSLADTIDGLLERLQTAFEAQRRFVANASHELRTPLAMMRTTLDVAVAKPDGVPVQTRTLDADLRVDLDNAERLLDGFLVLARAQYRELGEQTAVSLEQIITVALAACADQITTKNLAVRTQLTPVAVAGNETLLARMVENAVRHNQPHGSIDIELVSDREQAQLVVDSGGPVLGKDAVARLAQPFRRVGRERTGSENGHGLGLSIVAAVAAAHGGRLELQARPQGGLRVHITLPTFAHAQLIGARR